MSRRAMQRNLGAVCRDRGCVPLLLVLAVPALEPVLVLPAPGPFPPPPVTGPQASPKRRAGEGPRTFTVPFAG